MADVWQEFVALRAQIRDCEDGVKWYGRKRDESTNPHDYAYYSDMCHKSIKDQSDLMQKQNELHYKVMELANI